MLRAFLFPRLPVADGLSRHWSAVLFCILTGLGSTAQAWVEGHFAILHEGLVRTAYLALPDLDDISSKASWPVIIALHPGFGTGVGMAKTSELHLQLGAENYVVVYPDGYRRSWNAGDCCGVAQDDEIDDIGFILSLVDQIGEKFPIRDKFFVVGYSNGAKLAYRLSCTVPDRLVAVAVYAGTVAINQATCNSSLGVPLLHLHGALDASAPLEGGNSNIETAGAQPPVLEGIDSWTEMNRCDDGQDSDFDDAATCTRYPGCRDGSETIFCIYPGLGHYWPGAKRDMQWETLGPARSDLNGGQQMIRFFDRYH